MSSQRDDAKPKHLCLSKALAKHLLIDSDPRARAAKHATPADGLLAPIERYPPFWDSKEKQMAWLVPNTKKPKKIQIEVVNRDGDSTVTVCLHSPRDGPVA